MPYPMNPFMQQGPPMLDSRMQPQQFPQLQGALAQGGMGPQQPQMPGMGMQGMQQGMQGMQGPPRDLMTGPENFRQRPGQAFNTEIQKLQQLYQDPRNRSWASRLGSVAVPALFGALMGGNMRDALAYGIGSAAFNYQGELNKYKDVESQISEAAMKLPQAEADYDLTQAQTEHAYASAGSTGTNMRIPGQPAYQSWVMLHKPYLDPAKEGDADAENDAFQKWFRENQDIALAPKIGTGPFSVNLYGAGGGVRASMPGRLSDEAIAAEEELTGRTSTASTRAELNEKQYDALHNLQVDMDSSLSQIESLRDAIAKGPETGKASEYLALIDPQLQYLRGLNNDAVLAKVQAARASGVTFGSMTEAEWLMMGETLSKLGNSKKANLLIIDAVLKKLRRQVVVNDTRLENFPKGVERPSSQRTLRGEDGSTLTITIGGDDGGG